MLPFKENFTANHTLNSCLKPKAIMTKDLDALSTRRSGIRTAETRMTGKKELLMGAD